MLRSTRPLAVLASLAVVSTLATGAVEVLPGDTLSEIAARNDVSVAQLVEWNGIEDPDLILAGQTLVLSAPAEADESGRAFRPLGYVIEPGDTLFRIAVRFGVPIAALVAANDIDDPDRIVAGREILIGAAQAPAPDGESPRSTYTIRPGDTLSAIARAHRVSVDDLASVNGIVDRDRIRAGTELVVPDPRSAPAAPPRSESDQDGAPLPTPPSAASEAASEGAEPAETPPTSEGPPPADPEAPGLAPLFARWADAYAVPQGLLEAVAWHESGWQADSVGDDGRLGIGQLGEDTVVFIEQRLLGIDLDPLDADDGVRLAARYLRYLIDRTQSEREALAAWVQGLASVRDNGVSASAGAFADAVLAIRRQRS